jgi:hypothetical protein
MYQIQLQSLMAANYLQAATATSSSSAANKSNLNLGL